MNSKDLTGYKLTATPEQVQALVIFARVHGRTWKAHLNHVWMTGNYGFADDSQALQTIRNSLGPYFLVRFKLPK